MNGLFKISTTAVAVLLVALTFNVTWAGKEPLNRGRFHFSGDGHIRLTGEKSGVSFEGRYRLDSGVYDEQAYHAICRVFGAPSDPLHVGLSLRLVEFLDFLQDRFGPKVGMIISSGYRAPAYNTLLRDRGGLAAKASLHQYGMAADLKMTGVSSRRIWEYVKGLGFGGAGYYHGDTVHIDVGPARSWDEKSSGVGTGISDDNKLIGLVTDYDRYRPGDRVLLRFIRMTAFPIGVDPIFELKPHTSMEPEVETITFRPVFAMPIEEKCPQFANIDQLAVVQWHLPEQIPAGRYTISAGFCKPDWAAMPAGISAPAIEVVAP